MKLSGSCVYTIALPSRLVEAAKDRMPMHEAKRWVSAERMVREATDIGEVVPVLFADSRDCSKLIGWSVLGSVKTGKSGTLYEIGKLWGLTGKRPQDLKRLENGENIKPGFIRPYALCRTPAFLVGEAAAPQPWKDRPTVEAELREGKRLVRIHESRERATGLVTKLKRENMALNDGRLPCQICGFDFQAVYGEVGNGFAEAHHIVPLAEAPSHGRPASTEDLIVVCANCHRMLHRGPDFPSIETLRKRVRQDK